MYTSEWVCMSCCLCLCYVSPNNDVSVSAKVYACLKVVVLI